MEYYLMLNLIKSKALEKEDNTHNVVIKRRRRNGRKEEAYIG
jgi:hypothetical protein